MIHVTLTTCRGLANDHWGLGDGPVTDGVLDMIGWRVEPAPEDAGVPSCIAELLAQSFTDTAQVPSGRHVRTFQLCRRRQALS